MFQGERFKSTVNHLVTLLFETINDQQQSAHEFSNLQIETECKLRARRCHRQSVERFSMQSVFIKTNWPGEIQKDSTVLFKFLQRRPQSCLYLPFHFNYRLRSGNLSENIVTRLPPWIRITWFPKKVNLQEFVLLTLVQVNNGYWCRQNILVWGQKVPFKLLKKKGDKGDISAAIISWYNEHECL